MKFVDPEKLSHQKLIEYAYDLEQALRELQAPTTDVGALMAKFGITQQQALLCYALRDGEAHPTLQLFRMSTAVSRKQEYDDPTGIVRVQLFRLRIALEPYGCAIENIYNYGYRLIKGKEVIEDVLQGAA